MSETLHFHKDKASITFLVICWNVFGWMVALSTSCWNCTWMVVMSMSVSGNWAWSSWARTSSSKKVHWETMLWHGLFPMNSFPDMLSDGICAALLFVLPVPTLCFGSWLILFPYGFSQPRHWHLSVHPLTPWKHLHRFLNWSQDTVSFSFFFAPCPHRQHSFLLYISLHFSSSRDESENGIWLTAS